MSEKTKAFELQEAEITRLSNYVEAMENDILKLHHHIEGLSDISVLNLTGLFMTEMMRKDEFDPMDYEEDIELCEDIALAVSRRNEEAMKVKSEAFWLANKEAADKAALAHTGGGKEN